MMPSNDWKSCLGRFPIIGNGGVGKGHVAGRAGFTLLEMMIVIGLLILLAAVATPSLVSFQHGAWRARCAAQLRQLHTANTLHASDHGSYVSAAPDIHGANRMRWHGTRDGEHATFDPDGSPLMPYLGHDQRLKACPAFRPTHVGSEAFEAGGGGYGYNAVGVGSRAYRKGFHAGAPGAMRPSEIIHPATTVMFSDCAFPSVAEGVAGLIEYSFAEPVHPVKMNQPEPDRFFNQPSVHFRHQGVANVVWCDGHVSAEALAFTAARGGFGRFQIGWFGPSNNDLFDPY